MDDSAQREHHIFIVVSSGESKAERTYHLSTLEFRHLHFLEIEFRHCLYTSNFYMEAVTAVAIGEFQGLLSHADGKQEREINCKQFYQGLFCNLTISRVSTCHTRGESYVENLTFPFP